MVKSSSEVSCVKVSVRVAVVGLAFGDERPPAILLLGVAEGGRSTASVDEGPCSTSLSRLDRQSLDRVEVDTLDIRR